jgi:hypothetical protein
MNIGTMCFLQTWIQNNGSLLLRQSGASATKDSNSLVKRSLCQRWHIVDGKWEHQKKPGTWFSGDGFLLPHCGNLTRFVSFPGHASGKDGKPVEGLPSPAKTLL